MSVAFLALYVGMFSLYKLVDDVTSTITRYLPALGVVSPIRTKYLPVDVNSDAPILRPYMPSPISLQSSVVTV